ncbi:MAG: hypothetical protein ABSD10_02780 [Candidatus Saccharimonadales bacterium]|jgi:cobalamin biosynthesis Mg chelatase CobN
MEPAKSPYIRDFAPPATTGNPPVPTAAEQVTAELVNNIPVKAQDSQTAGNPIAAAPSAAANQHPGGDKVFDQVVRGVNREEKKPSTEADSKNTGENLKKSDKKSPPKPGNPNPSQSMPVAVAVIVALALAFIAFAAFRKSGGV